MTTLSWMRYAAIAASLVASTTAHANRYALVDLGPSLYDASINGSDEVAGTGAGRHHFNAKLRDEDHWHKLARSDSRANGINAYGDVVGSFGDAGGAVLWRRHEQATVLPLPDGVTDGIAFGINDAREVVGVFYVSTAGRCFKWTDGTGLVDLGLPKNSLACAALAINDKGQITGSFASRNYVRPHAFRYEAGEYQDLGCLTPGGRQPLEFSQGVAINGHGDIVGESTVHGGKSHAVLWLGLEIIDLHGDAQYEGSRAFDINDQGTIVGHVYDDDMEWGARFTNPGVVLLDSEVQHLDGWHISRATGVNQQGNIVAMATGPNGERIVLLRLESAD